MYKLAKPFFLHTITPLHVGSGNDLGIVDLPIQRERHTRFPKIEGSSLKGSIREAFEEECKDDQDRIDLHLAFGLDESNEKDSVKKFFEEKKHTEFTGALGFTDARILFFPVKSMKGVFAWITCPKVLRRFKKDLNLCKPPIEDPKLNFTPQTKIKALCTSDTVIISGKVILEEYTFEVVKDDAFKKFVSALATLLDIPELAEKVVLLPDDDFADFVQLSTEIITRTKINNETGTVKSGALFSEEYLPAESILYALVLASPIFSKSNLNSRLKKEQDVMNFFERGLPQYMQIGGNATIGKGIVTTQVYREKVESKDNKGMVETQEVS